MLMEEGTSAFGALFDHGNSDSDKSRKLLSKGSSASLKVQKKPAKESGTGSTSTPAAKNAFARVMRCEITAQDSKRYDFGAPLSSTL